MNASEFKAALAAHPQATIRFVLPKGEKVAAHAHVTEVARIDKHFVDCGGTRRQDARCQLQTLVADDFDHRLTTKKLLGIMEKAAPLLGSDDLPVDVEHEHQYTSQFPVDSVAHQDGELVFQLGYRHTECLAPDKCGIPQRSVMQIDFKKLPSFGPRG